MNEEKKKTFIRYLINYADKIWIEDDKGAELQEKAIIEWIDSELKQERIEENKHWFNICDKQATPYYSHKVDANDFENRIKELEK